MSSGGPARPTDRAVAASTPISPGDATITGGLWAERQQRNRDAAIPSGLRQLGEAKNLHNLEVAAGRADGDPIGPIFADSDVHKWLEAAAWEYGRSRDDQLLSDIDRVVELLSAAQHSDGYLNSVVPVRDGGRYVDLPWHHELYCAGHLIQAAVALSRSSDHTALLEVAIRLADHLVATFGPDKLNEVDGHPVIEMALVELYRETGTEAYLDLARYCVDARGTGLIAAHGLAPTYFSDRVPVREQTTVEGHAVRAVYLAAGATDLAVETGDRELLAALETQFAGMVAEKEYLTGGLGSRWEGEAFGDPYELPPDRAYAETCAAIGAVQWAWRLLLATGKAGYADQIERMLYNGFLAGVSTAGTEYFYVNPLQLRDRAHADTQRSVKNGRLGWFDCACCPPNVMRTFASLDGYLASSIGAGGSIEGIQIHQYAPSTVTAGEITLAVQTDYPWSGTVQITVERAPEHEVAIGLRIPGWADGSTLDGAPVPAGEYASVRRSWRAGDQLRLELGMEPRLTVADPRVDAVRGCAAIERGPLVYALELHDQPDGVAPDDLALIPEQKLIIEERSDLLDGIVVIKAAGVVLGRNGDSGHRAHPAVAGVTRETELVAVPYHLWANRGAEAMRVWIPVHGAD